MESDYISRQWLLNEYDKRHKGPPGGARKMIEEAPAADVRPVVFCRECRFWGGRYEKNECSLITSLADPRIWLKTQPDDFCSSGERREGGTP